MSNAVEPGVNKLVVAELDSANKKFPLFRGPHEGYAVTLEEVEELEAAVDGVKVTLDGLWYRIKNNATNERLDHWAALVETHAISAACEAIQVAAMCRKFRDSSNAKEGKTP